MKLGFDATGSKRCQLTLSSTLKCSNELFGYSGRNVQDTTGWKVEDCLFSTAFFGDRAIMDYHHCSDN